MLFLVLLDDINKAKLINVAIDLEIAPEIYCNNDCESGWPEH